MLFGTRATTWSKRLKSHDSFFVTRPTEYPVLSEHYTPLLARDVKLALRLQIESLANMRIQPERALRVLSGWNCI